MALQDLTPGSAGVIVGVSARVEGQEGGGDEVDVTVVGLDAAGDQEWAGSRHGIANVGHEGRRPGEIIAAFVQPAARAGRRAGLHP